MMTKEQKEIFHDGLYDLLQNPNFNTVHISESRRWSAHADIHAFEDCDEEEAIIAIADVLQQINPEAQFEELKEVGPHAGGDLFTTGFWCEDFSVTVYFTRSYSVAEAM